MRVSVALLAILLAPTALACTMGPVAPPGAFTLAWPDGRERVVTVEGRLLGAMCDLSNRHDLDGDLFAWIEVERYASGYPWDVHVLNTTTGEKAIVRDVARTSIEALGVHDRTVIVYWRDWSVRNGTSTALAIDVDTGERRAIALPEGNLVSVLVEGSLVAALVREPGGDERLVVYDDAQRAIVGDRDVAEPTWLRAMSRTWIALDVRTEGPAMTAAMRIEDGFVRELDGSPWLVDIDGDFAYLGGGDGIQRVDLRDGTRETVGPSDWSLASIHEGVLVHGRYSAPELNPLGKMWWIVEPTPWTFLAYGGLAIVAVSALGATWWWRATRRG